MWFSYPTLRFCCLWRILRSVILFLEEVHVCSPGEKAFLTKPSKTRGTAGQVEAMKTVPKDDMKYKGEKKRNEYSEHWYLIENWLKTNHFDQLHNIDLGTENTVFLVAEENAGQLRTLKVFLFFFSAYQISSAFENPGSCVRDPSESFLNCLQAHRLCRKLKSMLIATIEELLHSITVM